MKQAGEKAKDIIEKTSFGRVSQNQLSLLTLLFEHQGETVSREEIINNLFPEEMKPNTARVQLQQTLQALDKKLKEYSLREDRLFKNIKIERERGKGIRLIISMDNSRLAGYRVKAKNPSNEEIFQEEVFARFSTLEKNLKGLADRLDLVVEHLVTIMSILKDIKDAK